MKNKKGSENNSPQHSAALNNDSLLLSIPEEASLLNKSKAEQSRFYLSSDYSIIGPAVNHSHSILNTPL